MATINLMALRHSAFYSPYLMTMAGGHLKKAGFEANYVVQTPDNLVSDRLLDGSCHVSQSAVAASFASLESSTPNHIRHFAQINSRDGFFIAKRKATPASSATHSHFNWNELRGKTVLVDHFFQPMAMFKYALYKKQIDPADIKIIDAGDVSQIDVAFRSGQGDYVHQQGPAPQQLETDGIAHVVASVGEAIGPVSFSSLAANIDWLETDMALTFFHIYKEALLQCNTSDAEDLAQQLHNYGFFKAIDFQVLSNTIKTYQQLGCWNHDGSIAKAEYETLLDVFEHSQLISQRYEYNKIISNFL